METGKLSKVCWGITNACNSKCLYCRNDYEVKSNNLADDIIVLNNLLELGVRELDLSGGDPLMLPIKHITKLLEITKSHGIKTTITTNGKLLVQETLSMLKGLVDYISLSVSSFNDNINSVMGCAERNNNFLNSRIDMVNNAGIPLRINTIVTKPNINSLHDTGVKLIDKSIIEWAHLQYTNQGNNYNDLFKVSDIEFIIKSTDVERTFPHLNVTRRTKKQLENDYFLVSPNGWLRIAQDGKYKRQVNLKTVDVKNYL